MAAWLISSRGSAALMSAIAGAGFVLLAWMGRGMTFFSDEWAFIEGRSLGDFGSLLRPHNEHWTMLPAIVYRALFDTVGLRTYVPYQAVVLVLHVAVVALVFVLVRRAAGPVLGLVAGTIVAFLGSGFEDLYWGFQTSFVATTACGLGGLLLLDRVPSRSSVAALVALLLAAVMSAGIGLVFLGMIALEMLLRPPWRRAMACLIVPIAVYGAWFVTWGRSGVGVFRDPASADSISRIPEFVARGLGNGFGAVTGFGPIVGIAVAAVVVVAGCLVAVQTRRLPVRPVAGILGIVAMYALLAVSRAGVQRNQVDYSRYTYVSAIIAIVVLAPLVGPVARRAWAERPRFRPWLAGATAGMLALAILWNGRLLIGGRDVFLDRAGFTRALIAVALRDPLPAGVDPKRSLVYVPSPSSLRSLIRDHGSPLTDALLPWAVEAPDAATWARAEDQLRDPKLPQPEEP